jgi:hypothetical protein
MKTSIISLALGVVLAGPVAAYATEPATGSASSYQATGFWSPIWSHIGLPDLFAAPTTGAGANADAAADPFKPRRTDGLSSNRDACASYGCVGAGGGGD